MTKRPYAWAQKLSTGTKISIMFAPIAAVAIGAWLLPQSIKPSPEAIAFGDPSIIAGCSNLNLERYMKVGLGPSGYDNLEDDLDCKGVEISSLRIDGQSYRTIEFRDPRTEATIHVQLQGASVMGKSQTGLQ